MNRRHGSSLSPKAPRRKAPEPEDPYAEEKARRAQEWTEFLNRPRHIELFEVLEESHCADVPLVVFQYSHAGPRWKFCPKCKIILERWIDI